MIFLKRRIPFLIILSAILITFHFVTTPVEKEMDKARIQYQWMRTCEKGYGATTTVTDHIECLSL